MIVFSTKALEKFPSRNIYRILIVLDSFTLTYGITNDFLMNFGIVWTDESELLCRLDLYLRVAFSAPYLLVFISIEKFITIGYPNIKTIKNQRFQAMIALFLIAFNSIVYHPIFYPIPIRNLTFENSSNEIQIECFGKESQKLLGTIDLIYYAGLPFILMLLFSILLVHTILKSRLRILRLTNQRDRNRLKKDIQFAISSIFMNFFYLLLYLPYSVYFILGNDLSTDLYLNVFVSLLYLNYCDHFYILTCFNSVFRQKVLNILRINKQLNYKKSSRRSKKKLKSTAQIRTNFTKIRIESETDI